MGYCLLTGATGLVGAYLLRDLLRAGVDLAVVVRSSRKETARARVESILARWERLAGHALARPVILEGDISQPGLGLDERETRWVQARCDRVLHNAASLTFVGPRGREPWVSNLDGTQHVLELCERAGIGQFHHVSTAYVCGRRRERIMESDLDLGQRHGNDYEASKLQAELLVRASEFLDRVTVYRPGIIVGDSRSGYTSSYHGFYLPLRLVATMVDRVLFGEIQPARLMDLLALDGGEGKNLVPVDWVSRVMAHVFTHDDLHGATYHLTPRRRVPSSLIRDTIERAIRNHIANGQLAVETSEDAYRAAEFESFFHDNMQVYRAYWQDDPEFDDANTGRRAAPHLPCPAIDAEMLLRMCNYAIAANFGNSRRERSETPPDIAGRLATAAKLVPPDDDPAGDTFGVRVSGRGGGQWEVQTRGGRPVAVAEGIGPGCETTAHMNSDTLWSLFDQRRSVDEAMSRGDLTIEGNGLTPRELRRMLSTLVRAS